MNNIYRILGIAALGLTALLPVRAEIAGVTWQDSVLTISSQVRELPAYAFKDRDDIRRVDFEGKSKLAKIGEYAFLGCRGLESIKLPESVTEIGEGALRECLALKEAELPRNLKALPKAMFYLCPELKKVKFPKGVKDIGSHAFAECGKLENVNLGAKVEHIGSNAFSNCKSLVRIYLPSSVKELESYAFSGCVNMQHAELPANGNMLGEQIFDGCTRLLTLAINSVIPPKFECDSQIFGAGESFCFAQCTLLVPPMSVVRYRNTKGWKRFVNIIADPR